MAIARIIGGSIYAMPLLGKTVPNSRVRKDSSIGIKGVRASHHKAGGYTACITVNRKQVYLGTFATIAEAHAAYCDAAIRHHGEFFNQAAKCRRFGPG